jgi:SAM-dependent methyltransferase
MEATTDRPASDRTVADLVKAYADAPDAGADDAFGPLREALWNDGAATAAAEAAVPTLVAALDHVTPGRRARIAVLLGLLAECELPATDGPLHAAVRAGLDSYLAHLRHDTDPARTAALLYLAGHFPADRGAVLAAVACRDLDPRDRTRLERALADLDPERPDLGRVWPAPSLWPRRTDEQEFDRSAVAGLSPAQVVTNWDNDTRTVHAFSGARAWWAARHGEVVDVVDTDPPGRAPATDPAALDPAALLARHCGLYRCTSCGGGVRPDGERFRCTGCGAGYAVAGGVLDLSNGIREDAPADGATADLLQKLSEMPGMGAYYESFLRPAFLQIAGANWGGALTPADEDAYLREHLAGTTGPVLDLAAGAGRWTTVVAGTVGAERLVALDMGLPMLSALRERLPDVPAVQGSALDLPFTDAAFGAVNMWNALQAFPDDAERAIAEVGRVLRPGGTFTMLTFLFDDDPVARYFQGGHFFPSRPAGMLLFERAELRRWFDAAGLEIRAWSGPGSFVIVTAERR